MWTAPPAKSRTAWERGLRAESSDMRACAPVTEPHPPSPPPRVSRMLRMAKKLIAAATAM